MTGQKTPALVVDGRVDVSAVAVYAGEVRGQVEQMRQQLDAVGAALTVVATDAPDDQEVPAAVTSAAARLADAVGEARRALGLVPPAAAELTREALS